MIFSDGECPACASQRLHLNTQDLLECPGCRLVCGAFDPLVAVVMPFLGDSSFRLEDCELRQLRGTAFAKSLNGMPIPDLEELFTSRAELNDYLRQLPGQTGAAREGERLCGSFLESFKANIATTSDTELAAAWCSRTARTRFYKDRLMPAIAADLRLVHGAEEFKVDYVMSKESAGGNLIPKIYIESENDFGSANHEIKKLCSMTTPLRVLVTVTDKDFPSSPGEGAYGQLRNWEAIISDHHRELQEFFNGIICIVIAGTKGASLQFSACAFRAAGDIYRPLAPLVSKHIQQQ